MCHPVIDWMISQISQEIELMGVLLSDKLLGNKMCRWITVSSLESLHPEVHTSHVLRWFIHSLFTLSDIKSMLQDCATAMKLTSWICCAKNCVTSVPLARRIYDQIWVIENFATLVNPGNVIAALFYETPLELDSVETSSSHRPLHVLFEGSSIIFRRNLTEVANWKTFPWTRHNAY